MKALVKRNTTCRACSSSIEQFLSLGKTPLANAFIKKEYFKKEKYYPLRVGFCPSCGLVQLLDVIDKSHLFSHYVYFFSVMPSSSKHFGEYAQDIKNRFVADPKKEMVVEIGSNDGLLLQSFQAKGCAKVLGVDPAKNIAKFANDNGVETIADFFSQKLAKNISKKYGKAQVVIGNNVVAHIDNWHDLAKGMDEVLDDTGVFIFEAPYLMDMFENLAYDSIYHEHLSYLSVSPLVKFFKQYNMDIFDVQTFRRQGNSIRVFVCKSAKHPISANVKKFLNREKRAGLGEFQSYQVLAARIEASKNALSAVLAELKRKKLKIAAYGAPARGNTLLNYCKIGSETLDFATEELKSKVGLYSPGMHIKVKHIDEARKNPPDYYLMLAWDYKDQILKKESEFVKRGGKFIIPIGDKPEII
jgi:hypothetical protein